MRNVFALASLAWMLAVLPYAAGAGGGERAYAVTGVGRLHLRVPPGWSESTEPGSDDDPATIALKGKGDERVSFQLTILSAPAEERGKATDVERLRASVQTVADRIAPRAVEKKLALEPIGGGKPGFYFGATDKAPGPGEFAYLTQGVVELANGVVCFFTILTDDARAPARARALELLRTARVEPGAAR